MSVAGWITMVLCWTFVTGLSACLVVKTLRTPHPADDTSAHE